MFSKKIKSKLKQLGIRYGDKIIVTSDALKLLIYLKKNKIKYTLNNLIDDLIEIVGEKGNIIFPTFNWDFCKGKSFNHNYTKSMTGSLSNVALKRLDFKRSKNPIYSFAVWGKNQSKICNLNHKSCFGLSSPFGYLINNNAKNLCIGMNYRDGFTFVHVAEEKIGVKYRYFKKYSGITIKDNKKKNFLCKMYVRDLNLNLETKIHKDLDKTLKKKKNIINKIFFETSFSVIYVKEAYNIMLKDLKKNKKIVYTKKVET